MKKRTVILLILAAALILFGAGQKAPQERITVQFEMERGLLENVARQVLEQGSAAGVQPPAGWQEVALYHGRGPVVQFTYSASGMGSASTYRGINYSPEDKLVGFQGEHWEYWKGQGNGRLFYEPESDNTCYVERLAPCWYYFEAQF